MGGKGMGRDRVAKGCTREEGGSVRTLRVRAVAVDEGWRTTKTHLVQKAIMICDTLYALFKIYFFLFLAIFKFVKLTYLFLCVGKYCHLLFDIDIDPTFLY